MGYIYNFNDLTLGDVKKLKSGFIDGDNKVLIAPRKFQIIEKYDEEMESSKDKMIGVIINIILVISAIVFILVII